MNDDVIKDGGNPCHNPAGSPDGTGGQFCSTEGKGDNVTPESQPRKVGGNAPKGRKVDDILGAEIRRVLQPERRPILDRIEDTREMNYDEAMDSLGDLSTEIEISKVEGKHKR